MEVNGSWVVLLREYGGPGCGTLEVRIEACHLSLSSKLRGFGGLGSSLSHTHTHTWVPLSFRLFWSKDLVPLCLHIALQ